MYSSVSIIILSIIIIVTFSISVVTSQRNNACKTFDDYLQFETSQNCFYDPDMHLETPQLIMKYAGKVETYEITTQDGYILTLFRIPQRNPKGIILLHHPMTQNSRVFVGQGNESFAIYLWRAGYEIWLNNHRGTLFSEKHRKMTMRNPRYWDFSFHEMALYDIPSELELIRQKTNNSKVIIIGHSLGTTTGLIYSSLRPQEARNYVKAFVYLAPAVYYKYLESPYRLLAGIEPLIRTMVNFFRPGHLLILWPTILQIFKITLRLFPDMLLVFNQMISFFFGWTPDSMDPALLNFDFMVYLKDFSWKTLLHYIQLSRAKTRFQMYDYGKSENMIRYNSEIPPLYPLENILVPSLIISSTNDSFTTAKDSDLLCERLPNIAKLYGHMKVTGLNHMDYFFARNRREIFFSDVLNFVNKITGYRN